MRASNGHRSDSQVDPITSHIDVLVDVGVLEYGSRVKTSSEAVPPILGLSSAELANLVLNTKDDRQKCFWTILEDKDHPIARWEMYNFILLIAPDITNGFLRNPIEVHDNLFL
jgi:hypothetical protein